MNFLCLKVYWYCNEKSLIVKLTRKDINENTLVSKHSRFSPLIDVFRRGLVCHAGAFLFHKRTYWLWMFSFLVFHNRDIPEFKINFADFFTNFFVLSLKKLRMGQYKNWKMLSRRVTQ